LRICSHSRHILTVQGDTKNNKYLVFHKGANKSPLCTQLQKIHFSTSFLFESLLQEVLTNGQFVEFFSFCYPIY
jgi:hypothetical protein